MNKAEYPIVVHALSEEDGGGFMATVPDLAGCMSDGETYDQAITNVLLAMDEWADEMERLGRSIPEPYSLAEVVANEQDKLHELVRAQAALIKRHEQALNEQTASLEDLREQVTLLSAGIELRSIDVATVGCLEPDRERLKVWGRDNYLVGGAVVTGPAILRKLHIEH